MISQSCPRCGADLVGADRTGVAMAMVEHAKTVHGHAFDIEHALEHIDRDRTGLDDG